MIRRDRKLNKKQDLQEESSDGSDSENVPTSAVEKDKTKMKKAPKPEEMDKEVTEKPKQMMKKIKGKKASKSIETEEEASNSSDKEIMEKPKQVVKKTKGKRTSKSVEPEEEASNSSDEEITEKPKQMVKKTKGKKAAKSIASEDEASNSSETESTEKPKQAIKKGGKKAIMSEQRSSTNESVKANSEDSSDSEEKLSKTTKKEKRKKVMKKSSAGESSDESDTEGKTKHKDDLSDSEISSDSDTEEKTKHKDDLSDGEISSDSGIKHDMDKYKNSMKNLKSIDPDFYKFLEVHDAELLDMDENDLDKSEDDDETDVHVPDDKLHEGSDESDFEDDSAAPVKGKVTQQMITDLNNELIKEDGKMKLSTIVLATKLFNGAVRRATSDDGNTEGEFNVSGSGVFNNIINMCVLYLPNAIKKYLGIENSEKNPTKCKHFVKIKGILVQYLTDLLKLLTVVTSENILVVMLKHLHHMASYVACFARIAKRAVKTVLPLWSSGEETVRVLAFVCILRLARNQCWEFLEIVLKAMYITYVKNSKFVSPSTWPGINFMRRSLVEMFLLNLDITYPLAFVFIRQLGIHLRNAIMVPKRENTQAVYNWQYLNSLHLWANVIPQAMNRPQMTTLIFPLTMIISNTIKMKPTSQYYPLRFHLTEILIQMSRDSGKFIPIQGYLMDVLMKFDFNKKHKKVSMKPLDFSCLIRLNKSQMSENGFKDAVVERLYALLLEYVTDISCELSFPDVTVILLIHLRDVVNKCTVANYKRKFKQLQDKIEEAALFIRKLRFTNNMSLRDGDVVRAEQKRIKAEGTPLMAFYENWSKVNNIQKRKVVAKNDQLAGEMPVIKRTKISEETDGIVIDKADRPVTLFPSDSEDETDDFKTLVENYEPPIATSKQKTKKKRNDENKITQDEVESSDVEDETEDAGDVVKEFSW